jgi:hypothetical protein
MHTEDYGPFASIVAIAAALVAVFGLLLFKSIGPASRWSWLAGDGHGFMRTAAARAVTVALIGLTFITIDKYNYFWFSAGSLLFAILTFIFINWFDRVRMIHTCLIPNVAANGAAVTDARGRSIGRSIVIGTEATMRTAAKEIYDKLPAADLCKFLSGYGENEVNNPAGIWPRAELARIASKLTLLVTFILLCAVMTLYLAAASIEMHLRPV